MCCRFSISLVQQNKVARFYRSYPVGLTETLRTSMPANKQAGIVRPSVLVERNITGEERERHLHLLDRQSGPAIRAARSGGNRNYTGSDASYQATGIDRCD